MGHVVEQRKALLARVSRIQGQLTALKGEIEAADTDEQCRSIMQQLSSIRGAVNGLTLVYLEEHVRKHIAGGKSGKDRERAADDLLAALKSFGS